MRRKFLFLILCFFLSGSVASQNLDIDLLQKLNTHHPYDDPFWTSITNSIKWVPATYTLGNLAYGVIGNNREAKRYALESGTSFVISQGITYLLKWSVDRARPYQTYPDKVYAISYGNDPSFPSGHTSLSFAYATTMALQSKNQLYFMIPIFTWSSAVGYSRMRLGKHYPSDVLIGMLIGIGSGFLAHWATNQMLHEH